MKTKNERLYDVVVPSAEAMGYRVVQINLKEANRSRVLQVLAERLSDGGMNIDDCEKLSKQLSAVLDVEDVVSGAYRLEISSPGIDRPLTRLRDYEDYKSFTAKIETHLPINGRRRFTGTLLGVAGEEITIQVDGQSHVLAFADIQAAKLVLTDELIKAHQQKYKQAV
jgi:ribosome maturation factor RimP